ncbi:MAG: glycosyl transferase family protein [Bryobacteraceae bacterium]|nr:glycosyl transferase family protein [Bryobacteraceae bacterium]
MRLWQEWLAAYGVAVAGALAVYILISGLDDLALDAAWLVLRRRQKQAPPEPAREKRIAVLVPLWREAAVIERMLEYNLESIRYRNYEFFVGVYPNDEDTVEAVRRVAERDGRVHVAEVPHEGPTSKADCLNWVYQRVIEHELQTGQRAEIIAVHDAEDVIHPDSLARYNRWTEAAGMVQEPVLALPTPPGELTHGVYCDDFAESQTKDLPARVWLGGFLPGCGVGTAFRREELDRLAESESNRIFDPLCLTEDYDNGLRLYRLGCRQMVLPVEGAGMEATATREYFPRRWRAAVRQRTRWMTGNGLQAWERHGWGRGLPRRAVQAWFFWRDRKGLWGSWIGLASNLLFLACAAEWAVARLTGTEWRAGAVLGAEPWLAALLACNLALFAERMAARMWCSARIYGWMFALGVPVRMVWGNAINAAASLGAAWQYLRSKWTGEPLRWLKTEHYYPSLESLRPQPQAFAFAAAAGVGGLAGLREGAEPWECGEAAAEDCVGLPPGVWRELTGCGAGEPLAETARALPRPVADRTGAAAAGGRDGGLELAGAGDGAGSPLGELRGSTAPDLRHGSAGGERVEWLPKTTPGRNGKPRALPGHGAGRSWRPDPICRLPDVAGPMQE